MSEMRTRNWMNDGNGRTVASSTTHRNTIMRTAPAISIFTNTDDILRRKARILLSEIFYALSLSNRAYYQGVNRF
ncbi:MAG: hypothetical protein V7631_4195 [Massilia sp.]|jgi:hypothetical protein